MQPVMRDIRGALVTAAGVALGITAKEWAAKRRELWISTRRSSPYTVIPSTPRTDRALWRGLELLGAPNPYRDRLRARGGLRW